MGVACQILPWASIVGDRATIVRGGNANEGLVAFSARPKHKTREVAG